MKQKVAVLIFFFINFVFAEKYLSRIGDLSIFWAMSATLNFVLLWKYRLQTVNVLSRVPNCMIYILIAYIAAFVFLFSKIPYQTLNVDRWSVISSFWDNYFLGEYVYFAKSHMGNAPGPMPFYFLLALPFYLLGDMGLMSLLTVVSFSLVLRWQRLKSGLSNIVLVLLMFSIPILYEIICRSNLALNSILVLLSIIYLLESRKNFTNLVFSGVMIGLFMSIRNVFVMAYIITFFYALRCKILNYKQAALISIISILVFVLTFVPFVLNHFDDFLIMNPFIIQSSVLLPLFLSVLCIIGSGMMAVLVKKKSDVYFYAGLIMFLTAILHLMYKIITEGFQAAYYQSRADITYLIFCIPFLLYFLFETDNAPDEM